MSIDEKEFELWLADPNTAKLSDHYKAVAKRYAFWYAAATCYPMGRGLYKFMDWYNRKHSPEFHFPREMMNYWYTY